MKQLIFAAAFCLFAGSNAFAQLGRTEFHNNVVNNAFYSIKEISGKPGTTEGTVYLNKTWLPGTIYLKSGHVIKDFPLNYDVEHDMIEVETKDGIKVLPGSNAVKFTLWSGFRTDSMLYVNCDAYSFNNIKHLGFYTVLKQGPKLQLLQRTDIQVMKANYNAITNTGTKNNQIIKKEKIYFAADKKVVEVKDKHDFSIFGAQQQAIKEYAKTHKLKLNRKDDAAKLTAYFNSI